MECVCACGGRAKSGRDWSSSSLIRRRQQSCDHSTSSPCSLLATAKSSSVVSRTKSISNDARRSCARRRRADDATPRRDGAPMTRWPPPTTYARVAEPIPLTTDKARKVDAVRRVGRQHERAQRVPPDDDASENECTSECMRESRPARRRSELVGDVARLVHHRQLKRRERRRRQCGESRRTDRMSRRRRPQRPRTGPAPRSDHRAVGQLALRGPKRTT